MVRVGIIGADLGVKKLQAVTQTLPAVHAVPLAYSVEEEAEELMKGAARGIDVALFCGPVPYQLARSAIPPSLPATYIPYDGSGLVKALFDYYRLPDRRMSAPGRTPSAPARAAFWAQGPWRGSSRRSRRGLRGRR